MMPTSMRVFVCTERQDMRRSFDALERIEPPLLHLGREHGDLDARQMLRQRLAARRLASLVRGDLLLLRRVRESGVEIRTLAIAEDERENVEGELPFVASKFFGLLSEETELELSASFHRLEVEGAILVTLTLRIGAHFIDGDDAFLELFESAHDFVDARHFLFMIDARSAVNAYRA